MGSRFDKRKDAAGDFNTSGIQFMGGEGSLPDGCPVDRLVMAYTEKKELADVFKADDEDLAKKIATETYNGCDQQSKYLIGANGEPVDGKKVLISDKYDLKDAIANLKSVMDALKAAGFEFAEEKKEEGKEEEKKDDMMAEPEMMEGGEDMEGMMDAMMAAAGDLYADDAEDYNGCANLGKLLLAQSVKAPYFGDLIKNQLVIAEFGSVAAGPFALPKIEVPIPEVPGQEKPKAPSDTCFAGASGIISAYVDANEGDAKDVWFSGFVGDEDLEALKAISEEKGQIVFPGCLSGWRDEAAAKANVGEYKGSQAGAKVIYKINAKCVEAVVLRSFIQRLSATVGATAEADGWTSFDLTEKPFEHTTIAAWEKSLGDAPADATPAAGAAPEEEKKDEMEAAPEMAAE